VSLSPSTATFAGTLVEAVSAPQAFTVRNNGVATAGTAAALAALAGTNAADFVITSNGCGSTLAPGASCQIAVAFAPRTRSGVRTANLTVGAAGVSLTGTALPSLGRLAGGLGGPGNLDGTGAAARFYNAAALHNDGMGNLYVAEGSIVRKLVMATGAVTTVTGFPSGGYYDDGEGNFYYTADETVRKVVAATGAVTTIAGTAGQMGSTNGVGAAARFYSPAGIAGDGAGNLYVSDGGNCTIRKIVLATGAVSTFAGAPGALDYADGTGTAARFAGPGTILGDGAGNLLVVDGLNRAIRQIVIATRAVTTLAGAPGPDSTQDGTGSAARFSGPGAMVLDGAGNLYITDNNADGGSVRQLAIATGVVTTLAGITGQGGSVDGVGADARFSALGGLALDGTGNLYVGDALRAGTFGASIRKLSLATGTVTTVAGLAGQPGSADGTGAAARFYWPTNVASDGAGNLYVADTNNSIIRQIVVATGAVTTLAGGAPDGSGVDGIGTAAGFYEPYGIAADGAGNVYVGDGGRAIRKIVVATREVTTLAGSLKDVYPGYADGTGAAARFSGPVGMVTDGAGNLYVADANNQCIRKVAIATGAVTTFAGAAGQSGALDGTGAAARFTGPQGLTTDGAGNLYVADSGNATIRKIVLATGAVTTIAGAAGQGGAVDGTIAAARFDGPNGIASDGAGALYVTDASRTVRKISLAAGTVSTIVGSAGRIGVSLGALPASLSQPFGVALLPTGELAIVDYNENAVLIAHL
jgi:hypothetical protein